MLFEPDPIRIACAAQLRDINRGHLENVFPNRKPFCDARICLKRRQYHAAETAFAMDENTLVIAQVAELVRFDFVFFGFGVVHVAFAGAEAPGAFDDALFADEVGGLDGVGLVGGAEDHAVAEVEGEDS